MSPQTVLYPSSQSLTGKQHEGTTINIGQQLLQTPCSLDIPIQPNLSKPMFSSLKLQTQLTVVNSNYLLTIS